MSFKQSFKEARLKSGLSQEKVGWAINRSIGAIKGYESGISTPNPEQLIMLCRLFKITPNDLLGFKQQNEEAKMGIAEICKKTIDAIKLDIIVFRHELASLSRYSIQHEEKVKAIKYAEEIIEDLEKRGSTMINKRIMVPNCRDYHDTLVLIDKVHADNIAYMDFTDLDVSKKRYLFDLKDLILSTEGAIIFISGGTDNGKTFTRNSYDVNINAIRFEPSAGEIISGFIYKYEVRKGSKS